MNAKFDTEKIIPIRIKEARMSRGYSLSDLSEKIGVSSQAISQYEIGTSKPSPQIMLKMMEILDFPFNFFRKPKVCYKEYSPSAVYFRSMKSTPKKFKEAYKFRIEWVDEICQFLRKYINFPKVNLPDFNNLLTDDEIDCDVIEEIALTLRKYWGIEKIPIANMSELLEENGFVIGNIEFFDRKVDAFSQWYNNVPYVVMGSFKKSSVRTRFDLAHELGHLILHSGIDQNSLGKKEVLDRIEAEAYYFAGAFLLPSNSFVNEVMASSLEHLLLLKKRWKVSLQAMVKRCENLNMFSESQVRYAFAQINKRGYRTKEPYDDIIEFEQPYLLKQAIETLIENNVLSSQEILDEISLKKEEIDSLCFLPTNLLIESKKKPMLTLIKNG